MHNWGSRTNGPQGIWGNRGYGSQHVLIPGIAVGDRGAYYSILCHIMPYYAILFHTMPYYKLHKLYQFEVAKIMHTLYNKEHPTNLTEFFTKSCLRCSCFTRCSKSFTFTVPLLESTKLQQSFLYQGVKTWNSISDYIKTSICAFKTNCKKH